MHIALDHMNQGEVPDRLGMSQSPGDDGHAQASALQSGTHMAAHETRSAEDKHIFHGKGLYNE